MVEQFNINKISKSGAKFSLGKLEFLNQMHIREQFSYVEGNTQEMTESVNAWRKMLLTEMPRNLHTLIKKMPALKLIKVMDMMKIRMRYIKDIRNHAYFFTAPSYETELGIKFIAKLKQPPLVSKEILSDLHKAMNKIPQKEFSAESLNKACSVYLYNQSKQGGLTLKNEDVFFLFRYAITGNPVGAPIGEISEVIGKSEVLQRLEDAQSVLEEYSKKKAKAN